ncbi:VOC family protein [Glycomyces sp. NPDC021274]|uniref:VOC family protein n=1 Tax=Glycomyces sp. NPDC021274 TaxID=3155120 RepID=UPI0033D0629C
MASIPVGAPVWSDSLTSDLAADVAFYQALFGWTAVDAGEDFGHYTTFGVPDGSEGGREVMGVMPCPPGAEPSRVWNLHFKVEDCDAATARARELGAAVTNEPEDMGGMLRFSMLNDPNGAAFGLVQMHEPGSGFGVWGEPNSVSWAEYRIDGVPAEAMRFYADLLGWNVATPPWEVASNPKPYAALSAAGDAREFGGCHAAEGWELELPPQWNVMVAVDDAARACEQAVALGGSVAAEPMEVPGLQIAGIATPSGTIVGVQSPRAWE